MKNMKVLGLDVSKNNVTCCILTEYPEGGLLNHWKILSKQWNDNFPVFYAENPKVTNGKTQKKATAWDFLAYLEENKPDIALLEPTGGHYSRLWVKILESKGIDYRWIGHVELKRYRAGKKLQKNDASDALAHAAYYLDPEHWNQDGTENEKYYLRKMSPAILELRDLLANIDHLNRQKNGFENYLNQRLTHEFPEKAKTNALSSFQWLAGDRHKLYKGSLTKMNRSYEKSIARSVGLDISPYTVFESSIVASIHERLQTLDLILKDLIYDPEFKDYNTVFDLFDFGLKTRAVLLSRVYPFESFLGSDYQEVIDYEVRRVKKTEKSFSNGTIKVNSEPGDVKRIRRNRSRDSFKMRLGYGSYFDFSGDGFVEIAGGSDAVRKACFLHILTKVSPEGRLAGSDVNQEILDRKADLKGDSVKMTKHDQSKLASKVINLLYREFKNRFCF